MLDEGIVQPSESPWSSPVVLCSFLLSRRTFAVVAEKWREVSLGLKRWEAFHSLKKRGSSNVGCTTKTSTKSILMQAGTVSELSSTNSGIMSKVIAYASRTLTKKPKRIIPPRRGMSCHRMGYQQIPAVHIRKTLYCCN
ncbi:hypothetical protein TNCV_593631 [Trichonephila clavipes]|nr:hypothetical protein TNCV_593631 [Trichonephila clavipes]